jgi:hypothetical protein
MPDNNALVMTFRPVSGEEVSVLSGDFASEREALAAIAGALDEGHSLVLEHARYDRGDDEIAVVINLANVISVRVSTRDSAAAGQYL